MSYGIGFFVLKIRDNPYILINNVKTKGRKAMNNRFTEAASVLPQRIYSLLNRLSDEDKEALREIRLCADKPISCLTGECESPLYKYIDVTPQETVINSSELDECFKKICGYSVYSFAGEIPKGYITVAGGHRIGICGTAICEDERVVGVKNITSLNIRIAKEAKGCAEALADSLFKNGLCGVLVAGAPASGKTTILRDIARIISQMGQRVSVVDERGEIAAVSGGRVNNDLGGCCDILNAYPKGEGINIALRCLAPKVIICDEIGTKGEAEAIESSLNSGVHIIASAHGKSLDEIKKKTYISNLIAIGVFKYIVILNDKKVGAVKQIVGAESLCL